MQFNVFAVVLLFAFVQGLIYSTLLIFRAQREERKSDYWLALLILIACVFNLPYMLGFMGNHIMYEALSFFPKEVGLLIGPVLLYFFKYQTNQNFALSKKDTLHFLPYGIYFVYHLLIFSLGKDIEHWWCAKVHFQWFIADLEMIAQNISPLLYSYWAWQLYQDYVHWLPSERADIEQVNFVWYRNLILAIFIGIISAVLVFLIEMNYDLSYWQIWLQRSIITAIIYYISIIGYHQFQPRYLIYEPSRILPLEEQEKIKTEIPDLDLWKDKITTLMEKELLFLHPEITLSELSSKLNSHNSLISNVINTAFAKNFNDFINDFRVALFLQKVNDPKLSHLSLLGIAFECGFNSKSTFNRAVKKVTGQNPSELQKKEP